jgi:hypothetical protein
MLDHKTGANLTAAIKHIKRNKKQALRHTLSNFFDAASFNNYENSLASLLQTYIESEEGGTVQVANMAHQVRLITNLIYDLNQYCEQKKLLATLEDKKGGLIC